MQFVYVRINITQLYFPIKLTLFYQTYSSDSVLSRRVCVILCELMVYRIYIIFAAPMLFLLPSLPTITPN
jgi:hypothetical protein